MMFYMHIQGQEKTKQNGWLLDYGKQKESLNLEVKVPGTYDKVPNIDKLLLISLSTEKLIADATRNIDAAWMTYGN